MSFRDLPSHAGRVLAAARRLHPAHALFVTVAPDRDGPAWEYHPVRRYLVLRTKDPEQTLEGVACSLLARNHWLGRHALTAIPAHLQARCDQARGLLRAALGEDARRPGGDA